MLTDGRTVPAGTVFAVDLCIIGTGPAGLAIARELGGSKLTILLIERGDSTDPPADDLASELEFESPHVRLAPDILRNAVGGLAVTWKPILPDGSLGARYLPLDPIDFTARYWVPYSGWPITFEQMAPYYDRARELCGIGPFDFHAPLSETDRPSVSSPSGRLVTRLDQFGPATAFTARPLADLRTSDRVRVVTNAAAVELRSPEGTGDGMTTTSARTPGGGVLTVRSRAVVLAAGAIENARLLLNSTTHCSAGLGNQFDNVGRFFMEHPRVLVGRGSSLRLDAMALYRPHRRDGQLVEGRLKLSGSVLRREELLNGSFLFVPNLRFSTAQVHAARSARVAVDQMRARRDWGQVPGSLRSAARHAPAIARLGVHRSLHRAEQPVLGFEPPTAAVARSFELIYQPEQAPNRANRVTLSRRPDAHGFPVAHLALQWSAVDLRSIRRARQIVTAELRASGVAGSVEEEEDVVPRGERSPRLPETAHHLLGTTRMADVARHGVVDRACRVHGSSAVYVAGASVFPTGGSANPTLTVVALAIRLADELRRVLSAG